MQEDGRFPEICAMTKLIMIYAAMILATVFAIALVVR